MTILKCKMCGGSLEVTEDMTVAECEYCGTKQTVPVVDDEKKIKLFERANKLRFNCEFDKAASVYESIVAEYSEEAEGYWGLILCKYGIEYVDDPATGKKVPTCHRSSFDSIMDDEDFELVMENSDSVSRMVYREEAKYIEEIRKGIIEVSGKEEPYDIFICYKETDENGDRTLDSVLAQDVYDELIQKGYRVFFSRITLEDKLGVEYEPYIFAALNSAKIMLVFGTSYDYFNAVWVKNEWSRYLKLMEKDKSKYLIPCFKNVDAYDMPKEFAKLQSQDMGKVGAIQDLMRGIEKIVLKEGSVNIKTESINYSNASNTSMVDGFLTRAFMFVEDCEWEAAKEYCEKVLDIDPENTQAYLCKLLAELQVGNKNDLTKATTPIDETKSYARLMKYADDDLRKEITYCVAKQKITLTDEIEELLKAEEMLKLFSGYKDADNLLLQCQDKIGTAQKKKSDLEERKRASEIFGKYVQGVYSKRRVYMRSDGTLIADGTNEDGELNVREWNDIVAFSLGAFHTVGLKDDGTVVACGHNDHRQCNVKKWKNIISIATGSFHTVGLKKDGTVVACGETYQGQCDVADWKDITAIYADHDITIGRKSDGTVVACGGLYAEESDVADWKDVASIYRFEEVTVGLKTDGAVAVTGKYCNYRDINNWKNIVALDADGCRTCFGLKSDGTVVGCGYVEHYIGFEKWRDIVSIRVGGCCIAGLKSDGTIVVCGESSYKIQDAKKWTNIVAIFWFDCRELVGLKSDGSLVSTYKSDYTKPQKYRLFKNYKNIEEERKEHAREREIQKQQEEKRRILKKQQEEEKRKIIEKQQEEERQRKIQRKKELQEQRSNLSNRLTQLGLFQMKEKNEIKQKLMEIENELQKL